MKNFWKKYQIQPSLEMPVFTTNDELKSNMKNAYESQFDSDLLTAACGKSLSEDALGAEISRVTAEFRLETEQEATADVFEATVSETSALDSGGGTVDITSRTTEDDLGSVSISDMGELQGTMDDDGDVNSSLF